MTHVVLPTVDPTAFIAPGAAVMGQVTLGAESSIWYGCVLRGDMAPIEIGAQSNIQDLTLVHVDAGMPCRIGARVGVGHRVILHGCTVEDDCLIGMGAKLLNGAVIASGCIVGAGALVTEGKHFEPGSLIVGSPARVVRQVMEEERQALRWSAAHYAEKAQRYAAELRRL